MDFKKMFRVELERQGLKTINQMADKCGIHSVYLGQIFNGKRPPPSDEMISVACRKLGLSPDKTMKLLLAAAHDRNNGQASETWKQISERLDCIDNIAPINPAFKKISVYSKIRGGNGDNGHHEEVIVDTIEITAELAAMGVFAAQVRGDSMAPDIPNGSYAIFRPLAEDEIPPDGKNCAVYVEGWSEAALKQVYYDPTGMVILKSINPVFPPIMVNPNEKEVRVLGVLVESRRKW